MLRMREIKVSINEDSIDRIKKVISKKLNINTNDIKNIKINKKSIDARHKPDIYFVYEVDFDVNNEISILSKYNKNDLLKTPNEEYKHIPSGTIKLKNRPVIVGSGPAGLFAAYMLSKEGYNPLVIERGRKVEDRVKDVERFWDTNILNTESNVQFGEGGAGTFSDGKLQTLVKDEFHRNKEVLRIFVENGAPEEILYLNKPHIGTDLLRDVVRNMRETIIKNGGSFLYETKLTKIIKRDDHISYIELSNGQIIECDVLVLALGHSARDTFEMLYNEGLYMEAKPFAVGVRVMHTQEMIDESQYGKVIEKLGSSSYKLTYHSSNGRGVYSFCMCPGGYVVNASSETNRLAVNGMSNHARDSKFANSALLVTISPDDFGTHPLDGIKFQRELEERAYNAGEGFIPVQLFDDLKENKTSTGFGSIVPPFKGKTKFANLNDVLPKYMIDALIEGIESFGGKIKGYEYGDTVIAAIESRSSSPVRLVRDENGETNIKGIYSAGEGAGYAGGITSAAMDGIKVYEFITNKYAK